MVLPYSFIDFKNQLVLPVVFNHLVPSQDLSITNARQQCSIRWETVRYPGSKSQATVKAVCILSALFWTPYRALACHVPWNLQVLNFLAVPATGFHFIVAATTCWQIEEKLWSTAWIRHCISLHRVRNETGNKMQIADLSKQQPLTLVFVGEKSS